jgi:predicted aminopeptidase
MVKAPGYEMPQPVLIRAAFLALAIVALPGCGTIYLTQAAVGQWHVMHERRPIDKVLVDSHTPPQVRDTLSIVRAAREFASHELKLPDNKSYRTYADIGRPYVVWNVVATPEFSVNPKRWCFPIAGCVAYRGYFKEKRARAFAAGLAKRGYDVSVGGVTAYSTLGKLSDPVLSSMLSYGDTDLVATIFHELAHQLLYVKNDSEFNEAFAVTVEDAGLQRWLMTQGAAAGKFETIEQYRQERDHERQFVSLFAAGRAKLAKLYASHITTDQMRQKKAETLKAIGEDVQALEKKLNVRYGLYDSWIAHGLNNAQLASVATYYDCVPGFEKVLEEQGGDLPKFYEAARDLSKLPRAARHAKLCRKPL